MRRTGSMLIAVFAPSVAHAATCSPVDGPALVVCLAGANSGDIILLTSGANYKNASGYVVDDDITIQQSTAGGANPVLRATGTAGASSVTLTVNSGKTLTLLDVTLDNDQDKNRPIVQILGGGTLVGDDLQFEANVTGGLAAGIQVDDDAHLTLTDTLFNGVLVNNGGGASIQALARTTVDLTGITATKAASIAGKGAFLSAGVDSVVSISKSTISNFTSHRGGAIYAAGHDALTISDSTFQNNRAINSNNTADDGGCIFADGPLTVTGGLFKDCHADASGGAITVVNAMLTVDSTNFDSNHATLDGGDVFVSLGAFTSTGMVSNKVSDADRNGGCVALVDSKATVTGGTLQGCDAAADGGAVAALRTPVVISGTALVANRAGSDGGDLFLSAGALTATSLTSVTNSRSAATGGCIAVHDGTAQITGGSFKDCAAGTDGGAVAALTSALVIDGSIFDSNHAVSDGGDIYVSKASLTASKLTSLLASDADAYGGCIAVFDGSASVAASAFKDCDAALDGGAVSVIRGNLTIDGTSLVSNHAASDGGALYVDSGNLTATKLVSSGNDASATGGSIALRGGTVVRTVNVTSSTFTSDFAAQGGALYLEASGTVLADDTFTSTKATGGAGGALMLRAGDLTVDASKFVTTTATGDGGAIYAVDMPVATVTTDADVTLTAGTSFSGNTAGANGGAVRVLNGDLVASGATFTSSFASGNGGGAYVTNGYLDLNTVAFDSTDADNGGAIYLANSSMPADIDDGMFTSCSATNGDGGAVMLDNADAVVRDSTFLDNFASDDGGAVGLLNASTVATTNTDFVSNLAADDGGAVYGSGSNSLAIDGGTFDANKATTGGAVFLMNGPFTITAATFDKNAATSGNGGAVYTYVDASSVVTSITDCAFTANSASAGGGAVSAQVHGTFTLSRSDFIGNTAGTDGGGLWLVPDDGSKFAGLNLVNDDLFDGNTAGDEGGGIYAWGGWAAAESFTITDNMVARNVANVGGGVWIDQTSVLDLGRNTVCDNFADTTTGGGVHVGTTIGAGTFRSAHNNFFVENRSRTRGGGIWLGDRDLNVENNLFLTNKADNNNEGGGIWLESDGAILRNNLILGTDEGNGVRLPTITATKDEQNGYANNRDVDRWVNTASSPPTGTSFVFAIAPTFFSYTAGTPADAAGCDAADFRMWLWPDSDDAAYPSPGIKDAGNTSLPAYTDRDGTPNDLGPFGGSGASADWWKDTDGDGFPWVYDCNDGDKQVFPGATELCNLIDDDCDKAVDDNALVGKWFDDTDKDGYGDDATFVAQCSAPAGYVNKGGDCDDAAGTVNPGAVERCSTVGVDDDCDLQKDETDAIDAIAWYADTDLDTYGDLVSGGKACTPPTNTTGVARATDCNDKVVTTNPGAPETCNTVDDDCDTKVDEDAIDASSWYPDVDKDTQGDAASLATKACVVPAGYVASKTDCDDKIATTFLGALEVCNDVDEDCDGAPDDGLATSSWFADGDGDTYGSGAPVLDCGAPGAGYTKASGDCNEGNPAINPAASDTSCNSVDDDCDSIVDDGAAFQNWYEDKDGDKYGTSATKSACAQPSGYTSAAGDCDDLVATTYPNALETCNLVDDDCDGTKDDNVVTYTFYEDKDGDGYGGGATKTDCKAPAGYVLSKGDCDDTKVAISPGAAERCNDGVDQNCDGDDDKGAVDATTWYADLDKDGQGDAASVLLSCDPVATHVATGKDCDDKDNKILDGLNWYGDGDSDGYGDLADLAYQCTAPTGYLKDASDCNDVDSAIHPNTAERCATAGVDDDCDKLVDDLDPQGVADGTTYFVDVDNDTFGDEDATKLTNGTRSACLRPAGFSVNALDCDDASSLTRPGAPEQCDSIDNNCNTLIDDAVTYEPWWLDLDGDGFGDATADTVIDCVAPADYVDNDLDCDDALGAVNPNAPEQCNGIDDDCDGDFDESDAIDQIAYYLDEDGDNWAIIADEILACDQPPNHSTQLGDCDDLDIETNPDATEICDGLDNDCDGRIDQGLGSQTVYADLDGDGFGDDTSATVVCRPPGADESAVGGDCDDGDDTRHPDADEVWYDGIDSDCAGDDDDDQDGDGVPVGDQPGEDCDDLDAIRFPGAVDVPDDGIDQDCSGADEVDLPDDDRPFETDVLDTGVVLSPGDACGCATSSGPTWSLAALVAAFVGWRRARKIMPGHADGGRATLPHPWNAR